MNIVKLIINFTDTSDDDNSDCDVETDESEINKEDNIIRSIQNPKTVKNKLYDSRKFNDAMEKSLLHPNSCYACNEEVTFDEMYHKMFNSDDAFLNPLRDFGESINSTDIEKVLNICKRCHRGLKKRPDILKFSNKNNLNFGEVPEVLSRLNVQERRMVFSKLLFNCCIAMFKNKHFRSPYITVSPQ